MERAKRTPLSARKKPMRKSRRLVRSIVTYLKFDAYLYAPLFSDFSPLPPPPCNLESSKAEDLPVGGKLKVMMEVSTSCTTMREDHKSLRSDIAERTLHNGTISSPKRSLVILEGQRTGLSRETEEKTVKPDPRRVPTE
ncbi:hypothetical protein Bca52824_036145 [Brassica carinata]|uniref:Uncharacterized protein n=1 Tax=Brassica carinata TaxID=52824 RepID=A0A8X7S5G9_BRACI|nr:hypothetical protein Bca52824_036145 [Brassica carinata]